MSQPRETPLSAFYAWEKQTPQQIFLRQPVADIWRAWSYQQAGNEIRRIAAALRSLNLPAQSSVAILSKNCAHWIMADLAIMMAGFVSVPIYPTLSAAGVREILQHSEARLIFLGKLDNYAAQRNGIDSKIQKISFPLYGPDDGLKWDELIALHEPLDERYVPSADQLASIMYSSGTTGTPKGVMLSFDAFGYVGSQVKKYLRLATPQKFFSYLPLSHIAERALMEMVAISSGSSISFTESIEKFPENLRHEQPTIFGGVPRIYAKFQEGILKKIPQEKIDRLLAIPGVNILFKRLIIKKLGLARAAVIVCGAAPTPVSLLEWFNKLGIEIREMYGMTENTAYSHANFRLVINGTVGQAWPEVDVKIDSNGEVLVRQPALMKGYFKDEATTASVLTDEGFLRTGDLGTVDKYGFLTITGRVKDQFKTDKAKYIAPAPIEMKLQGNTIVDQVCVVGTGLPQPIALMTLSEAWRERSSQEVDVELQKLTSSVNRTLEKHEHIQTVVILKDAWTIETGFLTPSMKIKRNVVEKHYAARFKDWAGSGKVVVWSD